MTTGRINQVASPHVQCALNATFIAIRVHQTGIPQSNKQTSRSPQSWLALTFRLQPNFQSRRATPTIVSAVVEAQPNVEPDVWPNTIHAQDNAVSNLTRRTANCNPNRQSCQTQNLEAQTTLDLTPQMSFHPTTRHVSSGFCT